MKYKIALNAFLLACSVLISAEGLAQHGPPRPTGPEERGQAERGQTDIDRDRLRDQDRLQDPAQDRDQLHGRERDQDRIHSTDFSQLGDSDILGHEIMSFEGRNEYRMRLQNAASFEEWRQIEAVHRDLVQKRAQAQNIDLALPGTDIYGGAMMTVEERARYREQLRVMSSSEERARFMTERRESMQQRARLRGIALEDPEENRGGRIASGTLRE